MISDWKSFGESEKLALNPVEISAEATQTSLEKIKIVNDHMISVAVASSSRTADGRDVEKTSKKQLNELFKKIKISYRVDKRWNVTYKKLYTFINKQANASIDAGEVSDISNIKNLLAWYVVLVPKGEEETKSIVLILDAYTDQILAIDMYVYDKVEEWKEFADHIEDIPAGFLSYLNLKQSERGIKKTLIENVEILQKYKDAKKQNANFSGDSGVYAIQDNKQVYVPIEWSGYGFMINHVYD